MHVEELIARLFEAIGAVGGPGALIAGLFAVLFFLERGDRKAAEAKNLELVQAATDKIEILTREAVGAIHDNASATEKVVESGSDLRAAIGKIGEAVTILSVRGRRA